MPRRDAGLRAEIDEVVAMLRAYVVQETVGPLRGLGRYVLFGLIGAVGVSLGVMFVALAVVRVLQSETGLFNANWSFVPHLAGAAVLMMALLMAIRAVGGGRGNGAASGKASPAAADNASGDDDG